MNEILNFENTRSERSFINNSDEDSEICIDLPDSLYSFDLVIIWVHLQFTL